MVGHIEYRADISLQISAHAVCNGNFNKCIVAGETKSRPRLRRRSDASRVLQTNLLQARGTVEGYVEDIDPGLDTSSVQTGRLQKLKPGSQ